MHRFVQLVRQDHPVLMPSLEKMLARQKPQNMEQLHLALAARLQIVAQRRAILEGQISKGDAGLVQGGKMVRSAGPEAATGSLVAQYHAAFEEERHVLRLLDLLSDYRRRGP